MYVCIFIFHFFPSFIRIKSKDSPFLYTDEDDVRDLRLPVTPHATPRDERRRIPSARTRLFTPRKRGATDPANGSGGKQFHS